MYGDSVCLSEQYKYWWAYIPHIIHAPGYVYSYAYSGLCALYLFKIFKEGNLNEEDYMHFLKQGSLVGSSEFLEIFGFEKGIREIFLDGLDIINSFVDDCAKINTEAQIIEYYGVQTFRFGSQ